MELNWKILSIKAPDGQLITQAHYLVQAIAGDQTVESEGNWSFVEPVLTVPFADVTEQMIVDWIKAETMRDGANMVESRLAEQLAAMKADRETPLPWLPQVFTPEV